MTPFNPVKICSKMTWTWIIIFIQVYLVKGTPARCRLENVDRERTSHVLYEPETFRRRSCSLCFFSIVTQSWELIYPGTTFSRSAEGYIVVNGTPHDPDPASTVPGSPGSLLRFDLTRSQWADCCQGALQCCTLMGKEETNGTTNARPQCSPAWSLYGCWQRMEVGESQRVDCPDYSFAYHPKPPCERFHQRTCTGPEKTEVTDRCLSLEFHRVHPELTSQEENQSSDGQCCRTERGYDLTLEAYQRETCAMCYVYMPPKLTTEHLRYVPSLGVFVETTKPFRRGIVADPHNGSSLIALALRSKEPPGYPGLYLDMWTKCCHKAVQCCHKMRADPVTVSEKPFCPRTWSGWQCFPDTPGGATAYELCPDYIYFHHTAPPPQCRNSIEKKCEANGIWERKINRSGEHNNYERCGKSQVFKIQEYFSIACFSMSICTIIPALVIFLSFRQLRVARVKMHVNFFLALLLNSVFAIVYRSVVILPELDTSNKGAQRLISRNGADCKVLVVLTRYCRMCTYTWMLCEGFYLQKLIMDAFNERKSLYSFYFVGWVFPVFPIGAYAITRKLRDDTACWTNMVLYEWIQGVINLVCIFLNLIFLVNIIRVLITKLRSVQPNEPQHYRKAVRATLVLIPLFGVHFVLTMYHGDDADYTCAAKDVYKFFQDAVDGLQGFCVALLFCYMNGEVIYLLKRSYERFKMRDGFPSQLCRHRLSTSTQMSTMPDMYTRSPPTTNGRSNGSIPLPPNLKTKDQNAQPFVGLHKRRGRPKRDQQYSQVPGACNSGSTSPITPEKEFLDSNSGESEERLDNKYSPEDCSSGSPTTPENQLLDSNNGETEKLDNNYSQVQGGCSSGSTSPMTLENEEPNPDGETGEQRDNKYSRVQGECNSRSTSPMLCHNDDESELLDNKYLQAGYNSRSTSPITPEKKPLDSNSESGHSGKRSAEMRSTVSKPGSRERDSEGENPDGVMLKGEKND